MDFKGKGLINDNDLVKHFKKFHLEYTDEEIYNYLVQYGIIGKNRKIDKAQMAKTYFGHHFRNNFETPGLVSAILGKQNENNINTESLKAINSALSSRLLRIENLIKTKLSSNWNQIRKAFLDIDTDYDGFITARDLTKL